MACLLVFFVACGGDPGPTAAAGVAIQEIAIYQSLKRTLVKEGQAVPAGGPSTIPLIAARAALLRIFYQTDSTYDQQEVTARLTLKGQEAIEIKAKLGSTSLDAELDSTINFYLSPEQVTSPLEYSIELQQERGAAVDNPTARFPSEGLATLALEGKKNTLRVMLVPFATRPTPPTGSRTPRANSSGASRSVSSGSIRSRRSRSSCTPRSTGRGRSCAPVKAGKRSDSG